MTFTFSIHKDYLPEELQDIIYDKLKKLMNKYETPRVEAYVSRDYYECEFSAKYSLKLSIRYYEYEKYEIADYNNDITKYHVVYIVITE